MSVLCRHVTLLCAESNIIFKVLDDTKPYSPPGNTTKPDSSMSRAHNSGFTQPFESGQSVYKISVFHF
jgi:hypothetical protein